MGLASRSGRVHMKMLVDLNLRMMMNLVMIKMWMMMRTVMKKVFNKKKTKTMNKVTIIFEDDSDMHNLQFPKFKFNT